MWLILFLVNLLFPYLNSKAERKILSWEKEFNVKILVGTPSKSRLGVFIPKQFGQHLVKINNNLNKYSFLITLIHEMAHASIWNKYGRRVRPHGSEWKEEFQKMILPFLNPEFFPEDVLRSLSSHMISPKASTVRDISLSEILRKYDEEKIVTISQLKNGDCFKIYDGKSFERIEKLRKNYKCKEISSGKLYRFSPLAEVFPL